MSNATDLTARILRSAYSILLTAPGLLNDDAAILAGMSSDGIRVLAVGEGNGYAIRRSGLVRLVKLACRPYYILTPAGEAARLAAIEARRAAGALARVRPGR